jgi:hypothetical protein
LSEPLPIDVSNPAVEAEPWPFGEDERASLLGRALAGATLAMVALSWPLWIDLVDFPAIPLIKGFPSYPREWSWWGLGLLAASLCLGMTPRFWRWGLGLACGVLGLLILGDQLRLQAWIYQFLVMASLLAVLSGQTAIVLCRVFLISMYVHSGIAKLDYAFVHELGPLFLKAFAKVVGWNLSTVEGRWFEVAVLAMPISEIFLAILISFHKTRVFGYMGLLVLHCVLLLILGPLGLGHSTIVLMWNIALVVEEFLLLWPSSDFGPRPFTWDRRARLAAVVVAGLVILPLLERRGLWDSWPSHALYASHCERSTIELMPGYRASDETRGVFNWREVDGRSFLNLTNWSREVRGVPAYPQARYANGVAEWLAERANEKAELPSYTVSHQLRAEIVTGERKTDEAKGLSSIRVLGDRYWFNSHPRRISR